MPKFIIKGGKKLAGQIRVAGAKNAALKMIAASLLSDKEISLSNVPEIEDTRRMLEILDDLGGEVKHQDGRVEISTAKVSKSELSPKLAAKIRASTMFIGPLLARFGQVKLPHPGGCVIGRRPIDIWIEGFKALAVKVEEVPGQYYHFKTQRLTGGRFVFPRVTVTATEALMMTACLARGKTILINAAMEPEIPALAEYLNKCGAKIKGAGTSMIEIEGVGSLDFSKGGEFQVIPDRIETGSFVIMGALTPGNIKITNCDPNLIEVPLKIFKQAGIKFEVGKDWIEVEGRRDTKSDVFKAVDLITHEYPGFPTDLQAPYVVLMTQARGHSLIHETVFEGRMFYTDILNKMGADVTMCDPHRVIVEGPTPLYSIKMESPDIRAGIALAIAALIAEGESEMDNIYQIDRGYEKLEERLKGLGAEIRRVE